MAQSTLVSEKIDVHFSRGERESPGRGGREVQLQTRRPAGSKNECLSFSKTKVDWATIQPSYECPSCPHYFSSSTEYEYGCRRKFSVTKKKLMSVGENRKVTWKTLQLHHTYLQAWAKSVARSGVSHLPKINRGLGNTTRLTLVSGKPKRLTGCLGSKNSLTEQSR